ncbi:hypothetical protein [Caulobacter endophyticus]|uniref:hypothetical protein n=1 Tax=Caulobacter endophyticus TaxID=2172652 RepID=UPI00240FEF05|nr:hypothetical protein [Caulobacter endophyticus]MDG2529113.1 hypothetical protein [Caulobacter endophyticus]
MIDDIGATARDEPTFDVTATVAGRRRTFEGLVVSEAIYASHPSGGPICLEVHRGLLGARYVYAVACPGL